MKKLNRILIAKAVDGHFQKVSDCGVVYDNNEAAHPLSLGQAFGMTEGDHYQICRAAVWLTGEPACNFVDLECGFRVSLIPLK